MGLTIAGNPAEAQILCSSSLERSLRRGHFWDEQITDGVLIRFVDLEIENPGWMKVEQRGINVSCLRYGSYSSSYFRQGDADARALSLRVFSLKGPHHQLVSFAKPTRYQLVQIALEPDRLAGIASDLGEEPKVLTQIMHQSCHVKKRFSVSNRPIPNPLRRLTDDILDSPRSGFLRRMCLYGKAIEILAHTLEELSSKGNEEKTDTRVLRIENIAADIRTGFANITAIADLARTFGLSEDTLQRDFKARYGVTPFRYLSIVRLNEADRLLRTGEIPISEAARQVGFMNHAAFSRAYRKHFGRAPSIAHGATVNDK